MRPFTDDQWRAMSPAAAHPYAVAEDVRRTPRPVRPVEWRASLTTVGSLAGRVNPTSGERYTDYDEIPNGSAGVRMLAPAAE